MTTLPPYIARVFQTQRLVQLFCHGTVILGFDWPTLDVDWFIRLSQVTCHESRVSRNMVPQQNPDLYRVEMGQSESV